MTQDLDTFRADARAFLAAHMPEKKAADEEGAFRWGEGSDDVSIFSDHQLVAGEDPELTRAKAWRATRFDNGYGWLDGDPAYGGAGLTSEHAHAFAELEDSFDVPDEMYVGVSLGMVAPTVYTEGTPELKERYLRPLFRGDLIACQLFSEPSAGSDLANVTTSAVRDGDDWIVNGQKVWTSGAHFSDLGLLLTRTEPGVVKHKALTMFLLDMHAPGVEVRPLRQMTGGAHFNEVFLTDVRIPDSHRIGETGAGWRVALTTLMNERASLGPSGSNAAIGTVSAERLAQLLEHTGHRQDPSFRAELARLLTLARVADLTTARLIADVPAGGIPGPEMSAGKLLRTELLARTSDLVARALGPAAVADTGAWGTFAWSAYILGVPGIRLGGGTDEIMRNILAERVLGLPREKSS